MSLQADIKYTILAADDVYTNRLTPVSAVPWPNRFESTLILPYTTTKFNPDNLIWDFGDGTTYTGVSAEHVYNWPGEYTISLTVINDAGEPVKSTKTETITVADFVPTHIEFKNLPDVIDIPASRITNAITVDFMLSWQNYNQQSRNSPQCPDQHQHFMNLGKSTSTWMCGESHHEYTTPPIYTFNLYASGSDAQPLNIKEYQNEKYSHLNLDWSFHSATPTVSTIPITSLDVSIYDPITGEPGDVNTYEPLYYKSADDNEYIRTTATDPGAVLVGISGNASFFYRDDVTKCPTSRSPGMVMSVELDEHKLHDKITTNNRDNSAVKYRNNKPLVASNIKPRVNEAVKLNITSTGVNEFNINKNKWNNSEIHFIVTVQDSFDFNILDTANFTQGFNIKLVDSNGVPIPDDQYTITTLDDQSRGHFRGTLKCDNTLDNVQLSASLEYDQMSGYSTDAIVPWLNSYRPASGLIEETGSVYRFHYSDSIYHTGNKLSDNISITQTGSSFEVSTNGIISDILIAFPGQDLTSPPKIEVNDPAGTGAILAPRFNKGGGAISDVVVLSGGNSYTSDPTIYFIANNEATLPIATAVVDFNYQSKYISVTPPDALHPEAMIWALDDGPTPRLLNMSPNGVLLTSRPISGITTRPGAPHDIRSDNNRELYVCTENKVVKVDPADGELTNIYWSRPLDDVSPGPQTIEVDSVHIYICDENVVTKINKFNPDNTDTTINGSITELSDPGLDMLICNNILNVLSDNNDLYRIDTSTMSIVGTISLPTGSYSTITTTTDNAIYTVKDFRYLVRIDTTGTIKTVHDFGASANITSSCGDSRGYIWLPDDTNRKLWVIDVIDHDSLSYNPDSSTLKTGQINYRPYPSPGDGDNTGHTIRAVGDWTGFHWLQKFGYVSQTRKTITGSSSRFDVHSNEGTYNIRKMNEDHDAGSTVKSYALQPWLSDQHNLFNEALNSMLGTSQSAPTEIGKLIYEKISNFTLNNNDIDECNIDTVHNQTLLYDMDIQLYNLNYPPTLKRLMDMCSIKQSKLYGTFDYITETFDMYTDYTNKDTRENLGTVVDFSTYMITPGETIVAYEKFSKKFTPITTSYPLSGEIDENDNIINTGIDSSLVDSVTSEYPLSAFNPTWGWRLIAPLTTTGSKILNYYNFHTYNTTTTGEQIEGTINWQDSQTQLTPELSAYSSWVEDTGILDNMIEHQLRHGLSMF